MTSDDILVLGTDGLWDVVSNDDVAAIVQRGLTAWDNESRAGKYRYISLAQESGKFEIPFQQCINNGRLIVTFALILLLNLFVFPLIGIEFS